MAEAFIITEDQPDGGVAMKATFTGGWDPSSPAHQAIQIALKHLDSVMTKSAERADTVVEDVNGNLLLKTPDV